MTKDEALEKIRKLLETNGRTHAEAETAEILAGAIAAKHGIDIASIDRAEEERRSVITHWEMGTWSNVPREADCAAAICREFFEISSITCMRRFGYGINEATLNFIGTEHHLTIAKHVFEFLVREFRWQWRHKRGRVKKRDAFIWGCFVALFTKLERRFAKPAGAGANELEVSWKARRQEYMDRVFGKTVTRAIAPKQTGGAAGAQGFRAGQDIELRPAVNGGDGRSPAQIGEPKQKLLGF